MGRLACLLVALLASLVLAAAQCSPQTSTSTAAAVSFPSTSAGVLCTDPEYWRFTLASSASVTYTALFTSVVTSNGGAVVQPEVNFLDSTGKPLFERFLYCGRYALCPLPNNGTVTLAAGTWYLEVSRTALDLPTGEYPYTLSLSSGAPCAADSFEPNSEASPRAVSLSIGTMSANICPTGDVDGYALTVTALQAITFDFTPADLVSLRLIDSRGTFFPIDAPATKIIVAPGTYTLRVTANPHVPNYTGAYSVTLTTAAATCAEDAFEPNDAASAAKSIPLPFTADLTRCHWDDEDWFYFTLASPQILTVNIVGADIGNQDLQIIYPTTAVANPELLRVLPIARQDPLTAQFYLPAGSFYLRVPALKPTDSFTTFEYPTPVAYRLSLTLSAFACRAGSFTPGFTNSTAATVPLNTSVHVCAEYDPARYSVADFFRNELWFRFDVTETSSVAFAISLQYYDIKLYSVSAATGALTELTSSTVRPGTYVVRVAIFGADFNLAPNFDFRVFVSPLSATTTGTAATTGSQSGSQSGSQFPWTAPPTLRPTAAPTTQQPSVAPTT